MGTPILDCFVNIILEPKLAFEEIRQRPGRLWFPLVLTILVPIAFIVWYYMRVDIGWLGDHMTAHLSGRFTQEQIDQMRARVTPTRMISVSAIAVLVFTVIVDLLQALYLFLASKVGNYEVQDYGRWFAFAAWATVPIIFGSVASAVALMFAGTQIDYAATDVTSLNTLIFHLPPYHRLARIVTGIHVTFFWTLLLMIFGFSQWTKTTLFKSAAVVLTPWILVYAIWIAVKLA